MSDINGRATMLELLLVDLAHCYVHDRPVSLDTENDEADSLMVSGPNRLALKIIYMATSTPGQYLSVCHSHISLVQLSVHSPCLLNGLLSASRIYAARH